MAKVKMNNELTPSQEIIASSNQKQILIDSLNRKITVKNPTALSELRLIEILGDSARNESYMMMVAPILYIVDIDGDPFLPPASKAEVEKLYERMGREGLQAIMEFITGKYGNENKENSSLTDKAKKKQSHTI